MEIKEELTGYICGIDEAGRGPALVYGFFFITNDMKERKYLEKKFKVADSKKLSDKRRREIEKKIKKDPKVKNNWLLSMVSAETITENMLKKKKFNLNQMSKECACELIRKGEEEIKKRGGFISHIYVDTIQRDPKYYLMYLEKQFPKLGFTVEKKADDLFPIVSAASIMAKVERDRIISRIQKERGETIGSGYPSDPKTKAYLKENFDPIFGFKDNFVRKSWGTCSNIMKDSGVEIEWSDDEEGDEFSGKKKKKKKGTKRKLNFAKPARKRQKTEFHEEMGLTSIEHVSEL